jgi:hypothetical protein
VSPIGLHHLAFSASSRGTVDERTAWLREQGADIESGPREYDCTPGYDAVFSTTPIGSSSSSCTGRPNAISSTRSGAWPRGWSASSRSAAEEPARAHVGPVGRGAAGSSGHA